MIKKLLLVLLLSIPFASFGQQHVLFRDSTTIDSFRLTMWVRQFIPPAVPKINPFFDSVGSAYLDSSGSWWRHNGVVWQPLTTEPDSNVWATLYYVDSGLASISAGAVDTNNYIASITRLNREIDSVSNIIDSNNTIIYGSISALYDTLQNYVDTAMLNDSLQAIKADYVPYIGATTDVNLGTHNILPNSVRLSTTPTGTLTNVGQIYWDATNVTPSIPLNANVTLQMGQEMYIRARNNTGVQINDGQVVYVNDAQGNNPTIALANSDSVNTSIVVGVATENIADNATGFVTTFGVVNGFNTSGFNDGDALYLNTVSGQLSNTIPSPPHNVVKVAIALNSTTNGKIFVQPSEPLGQDTTFTAPYNSNRVAPTQRSIGTYTSKIVRDSASALRTAINAKYGTSDTGRAATNIVTGGGLNKVRDSLNTLIAAKGSGSVTSITGGYGLTGGTITTTGTFAVDSNLQATKALVKKQIDSVAALTGGSGGSPLSATSPSVLYKSGSDTLKGASKVVIDSTDGRLVFPQDTTTSVVNAFYGGGVKIGGSNRMGMGAVRISDTVSIPAALQRAINAQTASLMFPLVSGNIQYTNNYAYTGMLQVLGTFSYVPAAYNSTIQHLNYNKTLITTAAGANSAAQIRTGSLAQSAGIICGNTKFSGGGGRGTFTFSFPTYLSTERIMIGYVGGTAVGNFTADPSALIGLSSSLLLVKDAADATLFFMHTNTSGVAPTKVNTGITPNADDLYRLTIYIAPNSTYYMQLEVISRSAPIQVITINPTTAIPPVGSRMVSYQGVNNGSAGGVVSYGIIQVMEEIY